MKKIHLSLSLIILFYSISGCSTESKKEKETPSPKQPFPSEIIHFSPLEKNPIFSGTGQKTWDSKIRERGYILKEGDGYHMWYTGFEGYSDSTLLKLGYAYSEDGLAWKRYAENPVFKESWVEDMMVLKHEGTYYMFAEGENDVAKLLTSEDRINWENHGFLDIRQTNGNPLSKGPYGTPTAWYEEGIWYLFYERNDQGIWLATSKDLQVWTNVQDEPVITMGPEEYDKFGVAVNQLIEHEGYYYVYYHGTAFEDWSEWTMNVAVSKDLVKWKKYDQNPIMEDNKSSGITVHDGEKYRFYTMHPEVVVHFPSENN
ncbi:MAG: glycosylase [Cyclobacteriaceae bacterium]